MLPNKLPRRLSYLLALPLSQQQDFAEGAIQILLMSLNQRIQVAFLLLEEVRKLLPKDFNHNRVAIRL